MSSRFAIIFPNLGKLLKNVLALLYNSYKAVSVVNRIRELRQSQNMKQADLAKILKCAPTAVSKYELEQLDLSSQTIHRLCDIFGCTADYLLCRSDVSTPQISAEDWELLAAYHEADETIKGIVSYSLKLGNEKKESPEAV